MDNAIPEDASAFRFNYLAKGYFSAILSFHSKRLNIFLRYHSKLFYFRQIASGKKTLNRVSLLRKQMDAGRERKIRETVNGP